MSISNQPENVRRATKRAANRVCSRRELLVRSGVAGLVAATGMAARKARATEAPTSTKPAPAGKAESCVFIWLGGGACHIDTWDPKRKGDGKKKAGSYYDSIPTAVPDVSVCEHLYRTAPLMERCVIIRTVHHELQDHQAATNRLHTGRPTSGTILYPSIGSVVSHERGPRSENVPAYIVMGYPNATRNPGFLGAKYGYVYLTETEAGPQGLRRPREITASRQLRREALLRRIRDGYVNSHKGDAKIQDYAAISAQGFRLAGPGFMSVFNLDREKSELRESYGGEFGQRCLLARRLVQAGTRFIEVSFNLNFINGTGWDTHNEGQLNQHLLIQQLDQGLAALLLDLERCKLLDSTLVVVATEFGRPPEFDGGGGRGHHPHAFSVFLAGGGLRTGQVIGRTDDLGHKIVEFPVSVADLHATIYTALGVDPSKELFDGNRPVPITDRGRPIKQLFV